MPHVVYRSFGVTGAALGAAKKIDLTKIEKRDWAKCHSGGRPPKDDRLMVTGIWYVLRTGVPWRDLPAEFGPWSSVYTRFRRWCASGLWARLLTILGAGAYGGIRSVDCSHIKIHQDGANPAGGQSAQAMGRTKGGFNTKLAAVVDAIGRAVGLSLAPGPQYDVHACEPLAPIWPANGCSPTKDSIRLSSDRTWSARERWCAFLPSAPVASNTTTADAFIDIAIPSRTSSPHQT